VEVPDVLLNLLDATNRGGVAVMIFDMQDRVVACNDEFRAIYAFTDFGITQTYESCYWDCIKHGFVADRNAYDDPHRWLAQAVEFRRTTPFAQYMIKQNNGKNYLARHQIIAGYGYLSIRSEVGFFGAPTVYCADNLDLSNKTPFSFQQSSLSNIGSALVSKSGFVVDANRTFLRIFEKMDGVVTRMGKLEFRDEINHNNLMKAIVQKAIGGQDHGEINIRIGREDGTGIYLATVRTPKSMSWSSSFDFSGLAEVLLLDLEGDIQVPPNVLQNLFQLTLAEAKIAVRVASGSDISEIALLYGVSVGTIRNHIKKIYAKTGVSRRSELVRLISNVARLITNI
jgi:DNA-binding CsgD family transcriptional regulator